jgi:hypothetical protein
VFRQDITEAQRAAAWTSFGQDFAHGALELTVADAGAVYAEAESLCDQFSSTTGVRTLDLMRVAFGRILGRIEFLSFDKRQRSLAALAELTVLP